MLGVCSAMGEASEEDSLEDVESPVSSCEAELDAFILANPNHPAAGRTQTAGTGTRGSDDRRSILTAAMSERTKASKQGKWGTCQKHQRCLRLYLQKSGIWAGQAVARCPLFWCRDEEDKPSCWFAKRHRGAHSELPKGIRAQMKHLKGDLRWSLKHGPATRP